MLPGSSRSGNMLGMHLVWGRDVDGFDLWIRRHFLDRRVSTRAELRLECRPAFGTRGGGGHQLDPRIVPERREHQHKGPPQPGNA